MGEGGGKILWFMKYFIVRGKGEEKGEISLFYFINSL